MSEEIKSTKDKLKKIEELERQIIRIQKSTRTTWKSFIPLHDSLRMRFPWYYRWHVFSYASLVHLLALIALVLGLGLWAYFSQISRVRAATITWDGEGTDATCGGHQGDGNNWSCPLNWSGDNVPLASDTVVFSNTSTKDATVDEKFSGTVRGLSITTGYSGTVTLARSLQAVDNFSQNDGVFTAGSHTIDIGGHFSLSAGHFMASSSTTSIAGTITISGTPIFDANNGTINFYGPEATLSCNNVTFHLVTFRNTETKTIDKDCTMPLGVAPTIEHSIDLSGTLSGRGTLRSAGGTLTFHPSSVISGFTGLVAEGNFAIAGALIDFGSFSPVDINGSYALTSGSFTAPKGEMKIAKNFTMSESANFTANGGTVIFDGENQTINGSTKFYNLTKRATQPSTLSFEANKTQSIANLIELEGTKENLLILRSTISGVQWSIEPGKINKLGYLSFQDSKNARNNDIDLRGSGSRDAGNNQGWIFDQANLPEPTPTPVPTLSAEPVSSSESTPEIIEQQEVVLADPNADQLLEKNTLTIKLLDKNLKPIVGASVTLYSEPQSAISSEEGVVHYANLEEGPHRIVINYQDRVSEGVIPLRRSGSEETISQFDLTIQLKAVKRSLTPMDFVFRGAIAVIGILLFGYIYRSYKA